MSCSQAAVPQVNCENVGGIYVVGINIVVVGKMHAFSIAQVSQLTTRCFRNASQLVEWEY